MQEKINVTQSFLPPIDEYKVYIDKIYNTKQLTNQGSLLIELEVKLKEYLGVNYFHFLSNGTIALQIALNALGITDGEIITTPFSYVATTSSILWERCKPVFVDIENENFCIDANRIEDKITSNTKAIMAVHVFGYACDVVKIEKIAKKHNLRVIYDAAHAFGSKYNGRSLVDYGDISTCSFHATKLFHTGEGGACIVQSENVNNKLELNKRFGHNFDNHMQLGINAKNSEFHAAMGLANFKYIDYIINDRKRVCDEYDNLLVDKFKRPKIQQGLEYNYAYYPIIFDSEEHLSLVKNKLNENNIFPRRYFYPSLNTLPYLPDYQECLISEDISKRILCLPLYVGLQNEVINRIASLIK